MRNLSNLLLLSGLASASPLMAADAPPLAGASAAPVTESVTTLPAESFEVNGQKFILIHKLGKVEDNRTFEKTMQYLRSQQAEAKSLGERLRDASIADSNAISQRIAEINRALEQNNTMVLKTFGVSIENTYVSHIEKSRVYAVISDEEYAKAKDSASYKAENFIVTDKAKIALRNTVSGVAENFILREDIQLVTTLRQRVKRLEAAIAQATDREDKDKLSELLKTARETADKNEAEVTSRQGFAIPPDFAVEAEVTKLFVAVSKEQFDKWQAERAKPVAAK